MCIEVSELEHFIVYKWFINHINLDNLDPHNLLFFTFADKTNWGVHLWKLSRLRCMHIITVELVLPITSEYLQNSRIKIIWILKEKHTLTTNRPPNTKSFVADDKASNSRTEHNTRKTCCHCFETTLDTWWWSNSNTTPRAH